MTRRYLVTGDPTEPSASDMIVETQNLRVGLPVPEGDWRVLDGGMKYSTIARVVTRWEIEDN